MHIYKCGKVDYREGQIYSLDVHPSGKFLVTAGSDGPNGLIAVWSFDFITADDPKTQRPKEPKQPTREVTSDLLVSEDENSQNPTTSTADQSEGVRPSFANLEDRADRESENSTELRLCQKLLFGASQNCVRWSRVDGGRFLAAAGDSPALRLYRLDLEDEPTDGRQPKAELRDAHTLCGHRMEILHVEFSRCGRFLASCSLDASIIIWDMDRLPSILVVLNGERGGHRDFVTGLAWDPIERFLASQSSDKTLKIWRCDTWQCEQTISGPFGQSSASSLFRRLDWSADGSLLIATCATKSGFHTAKVIVRKGYDHRRDLVGFHDAVSCVRSSETCLSYKTERGVESTVSCVAVGSMDRSLSIWLLPGLSRPLCVIRNLFPGALLDMSWHGNNLALIGINGSVRCVRFENDEIGTFLSNSEMVNHLRSLYTHVPLRFTQPLLAKSHQSNGFESAVKETTDQAVQLSDELKAQSVRCHPLMAPHDYAPDCPRCVSARDLRRRTFATDESTEPKKQKLSTVDDFQFVSDEISDDEN